MNLRTKTLIIIGITLGLLVLITSLSLQAILQNNLNALENKDVSEEVARAVNTLGNEKIDLQSIAADWATWDDSYKFVADKNQAFINSNLLDSTWSQLKVNLMVFVDPAGRIIFAKNFDLKTGIASPVPKSLLTELKMHPELLRSDQLNDPLTGIVSLPANHLLMTSHPILPSNGQGKVGGTLLVGRYMDKAFMNRLAKMILLNLSTQNVNDIQAYPDFNRAYARLNHSKTTVVQALDKNSVAGYTTLRDIYGEPALVLKIIVPRDIFKQGQSSIYYAIFFIMLIGLIFAALTLLLMNRFLLNRLYGLIGEVKNVGKDGFGAGISPWGQDELGELAGSINNMLADLANSHLRLVDSETSLRRITDNMSDVVSQVDNRGRFVYCSPSLKKVLGITEIELMGKEFLSQIHPDDYLTVEKFLDQVMQNGLPCYFEFRWRKPDASYMWMETMANAITDEAGRVTGAVLVGRDLTARKEAEEIIRFISLHDALTGLYNRTYFEQKMLSLESSESVPVAMMICDLDGLKFLNDTLGHKIGDNVLIKAAQVLENCCGEESILSRIGGDEYAIIIQNSTQSQVESVYVCIKQELTEHSRNFPDMPIYMSLGFAIRQEASMSMTDLFREADNNMYREKLHSQQSGHSSVVSSLMQALKERDFIFCGHTDRMVNLVVSMGKAGGASQNLLSDLELLARFHDIGKVGITDSILQKTGVLTPAEYQEIQRHSEIGYRIARASSELQPVADWILKHHERWNGQGYPLGLKGEEIPLECRMLAIADAYDAMTSERPYRRGRHVMAVLVALEELRRCAGIDFDPDLVKTFVELVESGLV